MSIHDITCKRTGEAVGVKLDGGQCRCHSAEHCIMHPPSPPEPIEGRAERERCAQVLDAEAAFAREQLAAISDYDNAYPNNQISPRYYWQERAAIAEIIAKHIRSIISRPLPLQDHGWIKVEDHLPEFNQVVIVRYPSGYDLSHVYAFGARVDGETESGAPAWCWGVKSGYGSAIHPDKNAEWNDIECDDDYPVTHWRPFPAAPAMVAEEGTKP